MIRRIAVVAAAMAVAIAPNAYAAPGPSSAPEYWFDQWNVTQLWDDGARGAGITIAEIDTGVNANLTELHANVLSGKNFGAAGGNGQVDRSISKFGHGTAMASLMVAHPGLLGITGLAPDAKVLPVAIPLVGTSDAASGDQLATAIRWAADNGADIISMSLGGASRTSQDGSVCDPVEQGAIFHALAEGAVLFAAAGNGGTDGSAEDPGVCLGVVSVGAIDSDNQVASFSSRHPYLTLSAPGVNIPSLSRVAGSAFAGNGTSQATAIAAAATADIWSKYPKLAGRSVIARLLATLRDRRTHADPAYGYGILDLHAAVENDVPVSAPNPVYAAVAPFLDRRRALEPKQGTPVPPASVAPAPPGTYRVGSPPAPSHQRTWGIGLAVVGGAALVALLLIAGVRRRRRAYPEPDDDWHEFAPPVA